MVTGLPGRPISFLSYTSMHGYESIKIWHYLISSRDLCDPHRFLCSCQRFIAPGNCLSCRDTTIRRPYHLRILFKVPDNRYLCSRSSRAACTCMAEEIRTLFTLRYRSNRHPLCSHHSATPGCSLLASGNLWVFLDLFHCRCDSEQPVSLSWLYKPVLPDEKTELRTDLSFSNPDEMDKTPRQEYWQEQVLGYTGNVPGQHPQDILERKTTSHLFVIEVYTAKFTGS